MRAFAARSASLWRGADARDEADISSVTETADWKAAMGRLSKPTAPYRVIVFQITP
jgi:hypothetical protein